LPDSSAFYPGKSRCKLVRFLACEATAIAALVLFTILGLSGTFTTPTAVFYINVLTITAAVAATLIPILFYAIRPILWGDER
jgi:hypothetical protein